MTPVDTLDSLGAFSHTAPHGDTLSREDLRQLVIDELRSLGFSLENGNPEPPSDSKELQRGLHRPAREVVLTSAYNWLEEAWRKYSEFFADGEEINPATIAPQLVEVQTGQEADLFRLARYTWSLPYSKGYGRRLRFLIMDRTANKLIGILGLQSPPLSFPARDRLFAYPYGKKTELVNQTMDAYALGAVPPYSRLLGGKLVALAASSNEIRNAYRAKYQDCVTRMEERMLPAGLVALTTTSAYGRSSLYNRLQYGSEVRFISLGLTEGYGAFHLERLYPEFKRFLEAQDISTRGGFGRGPRIKWQTIIRALDLLGISREWLRHGVKREAFLLPLTRNLKEYMEGLAARPVHIDVSFNELASFWRDRWLLPRSERVDGWHSWNRNELLSILFSSEHHALVASDAN